MLLEVSGLHYGRKEEGTVFEIFPTAVTIRNGSEITLLIIEAKMPISVLFLAVGTERNCATSSYKLIYPASSKPSSGLDEGHMAGRFLPMLNLIFVIGWGVGAVQGMPENRLRAYSMIRTGKDFPSD